MEYKDINTVLSIAGSDCSGGAGIQADIKTILANGCYAMTAITSLTAQNTMGVYGISDVEPEFLRKQLDAIYEDIIPDATKIGMVSDSDLIKTIADFIREKDMKNIVLDPVMVSTSNSKLLRDDAISVLVNELMPLATLITPNIPEASLITGIEISTIDDMKTAGYKLFEMCKGSTCVLVKGGHNVLDANDVLIYPNGEKI